MAFNKTNSALEIDQGFRALKEQIRKEKAEQQRVASLSELEAEARVRQRLELEEALRKQPAGKGEKLSNEVVDALMRGDVVAALKNLAQNGKGLKAKTHVGSGIFGVGAFYKFAKKGRNNEPYVTVRDSIARAVFRNLASVLSDVPGLKVNFVVDENMSPDSLGEYDAKTNTIYVSKQGMDEATLLHELVHAVTVQVIHNYYANKAALTPRAVAAVEHLQKIAAKAKTALPSKFSNAFENLYEFVAYAMTDMDFQLALSQVQVESLGKVTKENAGTEYMASEIGEREAGMLEPPDGPTLWNYFTDTIAWLYKLFTPNSVRQAAFVVTEKTGVSSATQKKVAQRSEKEAFIKSRKKVLRESGEFEGLSEQELTDIAEEQLAIEIAEEQLATEETETTTEVKESRKKKKEAKAEDEAEFQPIDTAEGALDSIEDIEKKIEEAEEEAEEKIKFEAGDFYTDYGLTNLQKVINVEPGYRGNLLLEVSAAFQDILAAPQAGIERLAGIEGIETRLQSKAQPTTKKAGPVSQQTDAEFEENLVGDNGQLRLKDRGAKAALRNLFTYENIVQKLQNERRVVKRIFDRANKLGIVNVSGTGINDVWTQLTLSTGMAVDIYSKEIKNLSDEVHGAVEAYAKKLDIPISKALSQIHAILEARHEPERRAVKFLRNVPLDDQKKYSIKGLNDEKGNPLQMSPAGWRQYIFEQLSRPDFAPTATEREQKARDFRALLEQMVNNKAMRGPVKVTTTDPALRQKQIDAVFDKDSELYSVIASRTSAEIARMRRIFDKKEHAREIERVVDAVKKVQKKTEQLNKESNYWSIPVQNVVEFYGYDNYVPFKGRPGATQLDDETDINSRRVGGELQEMTDTFEGRKSESENPLLQTLAEGASAALRAGRRDLTLSIKNAIKDKILSGKPLTDKNKITFADRYLRGETKKELGGPNKIFHYNEDGTVDVLELTDKRQVDAIRRGYRVSSPMIDVMNSVTSFVGQTHTRYNPAFAPMNFVRDSFTNAAFIGAEFGVKLGARLINKISTEVANGGPYRAAKFALLYSNGNFAEINRLAGGTAPYDTLTPSQKYYRDISTYVTRGGKVSYLQGVAAKGALDGLLKEIGRSQVIKTIEQSNKFFDIYNEMFEFSARVAAFRVMRQHFMSEGDTAEDAEVRATAYAKNLANFEQVGQYGKAAGAFFMFFRPAATGAVRAIDALRPMFGFDEASFKAEEKNNGRTPEQIERAVKKMREERDNARRMAAVLAGTGVAAYYMAQMMAGDDEEERNRVATDDMARWTRYARFFIPGLEKPIQIPWGFGPGAFAAIGAQLAAVVGSGGRVGLGEALSNIALIGLDSFLPLPFSRISPIDNFPAFAIDSALPSVARPMVEYVMNLDGLGREIYNNRQTRYGDAYTGGDNIPEVYKSLARWMFNNIGAGEIDVSPNVLYFFASNYFDGFTKVAATGYNLGLTLAGQKDFDLKNDTLFASSFIGSKSNVDARDFSKAETYIKGLEKRINSLKSVDPVKFAGYLAEHPEEYALVQYYNKQVNGTLRDLRKDANRIRASTDLTPGERKEQIEMIVNLQNMVKRQILFGVETISGYKP